MAPAGRGEVPSEHGSGRSATVWLARGSPGKVMVQVSAADGAVLSEGEWDGAEGATPGLAVQGLLVGA